MEEIVFDPAQMERGPANETRKAGPSNQAPPSAGMVSNPIYTAKGFDSPTRSNKSRRMDSMASWAQVIPEDQRHPASQPSESMSSPGLEAPRSPRSPDNLSLQSLDIEGMLNMATLQSEAYSSRKNSEATILGASVPPPIRSIENTYLQPQDRDLRHMRNPSDVPGGPDSMAFSGYSVGSFSNERASTVSSILNTPGYLKLARGSIGLPGSPRVGSPRNGSPKPRLGVANSGGRLNSGYSSRSSSDWYGVAK